ncbi:MAG: hypothetical protein KDD69_09450 [Bdellovibrionales bacterium]|nr:hypothetical protein [Bdellovibrionales bacterium]
MLTGFHWVLVVGLGILCIAALKADYNTRVMLVGGLIAVLVFYKMQQKRR